MAKKLKRRKRSKGYEFFVSSVRRIIAILLLALVVLSIIVLARAANRIGYNVFHQTGVDPEPGKQVIIMIPPDATTREIATILNNAGLIEDVNLFMFQERFSPYHGNDEGYKNGQYRLSTAMTPNEILAVLSGEEGDLDAGA